SLPGRRVEARRPFGPLIVSRPPLHRPQRDAVTLGDRGLSPAFAVVVPVGEHLVGVDAALGAGALTLRHHPAWQPIGCASCRRRLRIRRLRFPAARRRLDALQPTDPLLQVLEHLARHARRQAHTIYGELAREFDDALHGPSADAHLGARRVDRFLLIHYDSFFLTLRPHTVCISGSGSSVVGKSSAQTSRIHNLAPNRSWPITS